jgi:peptidase M23-like protein
VAKRLSVVFGLFVASSLSAQQIPPLPDSTGWGVHVLALARGPDSSLWVGTYQQGIFVLRPGATQWEHITTSSDTAAHSISFDFVHAFAFGPRGQVWYGTVGNGWGLSTDNGKTWRNWTGRELGKDWVYVTPNGIVTRGDTTYIATADGIKVTGDDGKTWVVITDSAGAATTTDSVIGRIQNQYVLAIALGEGSNFWISTLRGLGHTPDGGRTWHEQFAPPPCKGLECIPAAQMLLVDSQRRLWVASEQGLFRFGAECGGWRRINTPWSWLPRQLLEWDGKIIERDHGGGYSLQPGETGFCDARYVGRSTGLGSDAGEDSLVSRFPQRSPEAERVINDSEPALPGALKHTWFRRPIALTDQPYIDQTYRFGSTMGGFFQPHQGVEFNNPNGTPVHAIGDGVVVFAGKAEAGANTVAIRHDQKLNGQYVFSVYYHNTRLVTETGRRVKAGDVIALVGNTGRATNDHLHLEVHVAPTTDTSKIVHPDVRYPPFNTNPELWIEPLPRTGLVAGQVFDSKGHQVPQSRIYGLGKQAPRETPFSFIETYGPRNHSDPVYQEHFAISDVPPGEYVLGVEIEGKRVFRRVRVAAGKLTWVEFRP